MTLCTDTEVEQGFKSIPHGKLKKKEDLPLSMHYTYNRTISPYVLLMEEGYITTSLFLHGNVSRGRFDFNVTHQ